MHKHNHQPNAKLIARMSKIVGHTNSIKVMIEENRDCTEILIQIAAVRSALNSVGKLLLDDHIQYCVLEALEEGSNDQDEILNNLKDAISKFIR
ncbi:Copper-sensing transcriptional repressor RicR [anaerobic digester metagenome]